MSVRVYEDQTIMLKGEHIPCIVDKDEIIVIYQGYKIRLNKHTGQIIEKFKYVNELEWFENSEGVCHRPDYYIQNNRKCSKCPYLGFCKCRLNPLQFKKVEKKVETDTPPVDVDSGICDKPE